MTSKQRVINKKRLVETFIKLASIESPSLNEKMIVQHVSGLLSSMGLEIYIDNCGKIIGSNTGNIIALFKNRNNSGGQPIFLGAHLDTVKLSGRVEPEVRDGRIINNVPGCILGADDKVAVAAIIEALRVIIEYDIQTCDIYLIFTIAEEIGVMGAKCVDMNRINARYGFVFDSEGDIGTIINRAPFQDSMFVTFRGKAAHAGIEPEKGINSIKAASAAVSKMDLGRIDIETTANVGRIEGGAARNIIPEITKIEMEARSLDLSKLKNTTKNMMQIVKESAKKNKAKVEYKVVREYDGFELCPGEVPLKVAEDVIKNMGIKPVIKASGGGSDINIFNSRGKKSVNLSAGMEKVHTGDEFVKIDQLELLGQLVLEICKYKI